MKEYAVNIKNSESDERWNTSDWADWYTKWDEAFEEAEKAFAEDETTTEVILTVYTNGEPEDFPLEFIKHDGIISQYKNGQLLCM
jgi:hypothetical protein